MNRYLCAFLLKQKKLYQCPGGLQNFTGAFIWTRSLTRADEIPTGRDISLNQLINNQRGKV